MSLWLDGKFWGPWIIDNYVPEIEHLHDAFMQRMLPAMPDAEQEADALVNERWERAMSRPSDGSEDPSEIAEWAYGLGIERYLRLSRVRQSVLNTGTVMLWHLVEQQILCFHQRQVLSKKEEYDIMQNEELHRKLYNIGTFERRLAKSEFGLDQIAEWEKLDELRFVANTVKHGAGHSARKLYIWRPDLFSPPGSDELGDAFSTQPRRVERPASGEDLYVTEKDIEDYFDAATEFWRKFSELIQRQ
jgi:hypothetical protein